MRLEQYIRLKGGDEKNIEYIHDKYPITKHKDNIEDYPKQLLKLVDKTLEEIVDNRVSKVLKYFLDNLEEGKPVTSISYPEEGYLKGMDYTLDTEMYGYHFIVRIDGDVISGVAYPNKN